MQKRYLMRAFTISSRLCTEDLQTNGLFWEAWTCTKWRVLCCFCIHEIVCLSTAAKQISVLSAQVKKRVLFLLFNPGRLAEEVDFENDVMWLFADSAMISLPSTPTCYLGGRSLDNFDDWFNVLNGEALKHNFCQATTRWATHIESIRKFVSLPLFRCVSPYSGENQYQNKRISAFQMRT